MAGIPRKGGGKGADRVSAADVRRERIKQMLLLGHSLADIAKAVGLSVSGVRSAADKLQPELTAERERLREATKSVADILQEAAPDAAQRLHQLTLSADHGVAARACIALLDRTGHGPSSKVEMVNPYSGMSLDQLRAEVASLQDEVGDGVGE